MDAISIVEMGPPISDTDEWAKCACVVVSEYLMRRGIDPIFFSGVAAYTLLGLHMELLATRLGGGILGQVAEMCWREASGIAGAAFAAEWDREIGGQK